jgi:acyl-CoA reductase-like NAD-dependent aldehyde dehydrogenase
VNTSMMRELRAPFGGYKESGLGREGGDACAALFTQEKTVTYKVLEPRV